MPRPRRRTAALSGVFVGLTLAGVLALGPPVVASTQQPRSVACDPPTTGPVVEPIGDSSVLAVPYVDGARCTWMVSLHNAGYLPVRLTDVVIDHEPGWEGLLTFESVSIARPTDGPPDDGDVALEPMREVVLRPGQHVVVGLRAVMGNCDRRGGEPGTEYHHTWPVRYRVLGLVPRTGHVRVDPHVGVVLDDASCAGA